MTGSDNGVLLRGDDVAAHFSWWRWRQYRQRAIA